jgi:hypothetical protein
VTVSRRDPGAGPPADLVHLLAFGERGEVDEPSLEAYVLDHQVGMLPYARQRPELLRVLDHLSALWVQHEDAIRAAASPAAPWVEGLLHAYNEQEEP